MVGGAHPTRLYTDCREGHLLAFTAVPQPSSPGTHAEDYLPSGASIIFPTTGHLVQTAGEETVALEVAGKTIPLTSAPKWAAHGLALLDVRVAEHRWPDALRRSATEPEDCLAVGDPATAPLPLAASRLTPSEHSWVIDPAVSIDGTWHGASVLARHDGQLVGIILVEGDAARVALLPPVSD